MSKFNHAICDDCWDEQHPDRPSPRVNEGELEHCCWCGRHTVSGIYVREDPELVPHPPTHP